MIRPIIVSNVLEGSYSGQVNEMLSSFLTDEGFTEGSLNDRLYKYLQYVGYTGSLSDMLSSWDGSSNEVTELDEDTGPTDPFWEETWMALDLTLGLTSTDAVTGSDLSLYEGSPSTYGEDGIRLVDNSYEVPDNLSSDMLPEGDFCFEVFGWSVDSNLDMCSIFGREDVTESIRGPNLYYRYWASRFVFILSTSWSTYSPSFNFTVVSGVSYDLCVERVGGTLTMYVDGVSVGTASVSGTNRTDSDTAIILGGRTAQSDTMTGYIKQTRITHSARYKGDYDVPEWLTN